MIFVKDIDVFCQLVKVPMHDKLVDVLRWLEGLYPGRMTITSPYRAGDRGVHGTIPLRGVDLRSRNYSNPAKIEEHINQVWQYDPERPELRVCVMHDAGSGMHFHVQVHPKTAKKQK